MQREQLDDLKHRVLEIMNKKEDSFLIYPLCEDCTAKAKSLGKGNIFIPATFQIL